jgi:diketogulonate reductase-like aldo/keto reductase
MTSDQSPAASAVPQDAATLSSGARMPLLGFGTWQIKGSTATVAVRAALRAGYRHLDTATVYGNETQVGAGLADSGVARDDVFVTTKCPPRNTGRELDTLRASLDALGTDRVDLWLFHWPGGSGADVDMWRAFVDAREQGLARAIGVSNYSLDQVDELTEVTGDTPAVNQVEWSPLLFDRAVLDGHRERGVVLEGYSALRGGTLDNPVIREVAASHGRSTAQVIIRWHLQHGVVVIPKSEKEERIVANAQVGDFTLSEQDMDRIDELGQPS